MTITTLNCFEKFNCIAEKCTHSCCKGWEIYIDKKSVKKYKKLSETDDNFFFNIDYIGEKFILKNGQCPFLDKDGLCSMIKTYGKDILCNVCAFHPRYKNKFSQKVEYGVSISCEEGLRLLVEFPLDIKEISVNGKPTKLKKSEIEILSFRRKCFDIIQDKTLSVKEIVSAMFSLAGKSENKLFSLDLKKIYFDLEYMNGDFKNFFSGNLRLPDTLKTEHIFKRILIYFIHRNIGNEKDFIIVKNKLLLSLFMALSIVSVSTENNVLTVAREYSAEIEYSTNNYLSLQKTIENL